MDADSSTTAPVLGREPASWSTLPLPQFDQHGELAYLQQVFLHWCRDAGVREAALYLARECGATESAPAEARAAKPTYRRHLTFGRPEPFPIQLQPPHPPDLAALELSDAAVLYSAPLADPAEVVPAATALLGAAARLVQLRRQLKEHSFKAKYRGVELQALYDVGLAIASTLDLEQVTEEILLRAVSLLDARQGALYRREHDRYLLRRAIGADAGTEVHAGDPELRRLLAGHRCQGSEPLLPAARHMLAVPIEIDGQPRGLLVLGDKESRHGVGPFSPSDLRTLSLFAHQAAIALENAELHHQALEKQRMEQDMRLAAEIQRQILPACLPRVAGLEIYGWNRPARHVGGDYYDVLQRPDGSLVLTVADVTGKGMAAALLVSNLHSALRLLLDQVSVGSELMERLSRHILELSLPNKFITVLVAELRPQAGQLRYVNAGHNPGLLLHGPGSTTGGDRVTLLATGGPPVGLLAGCRYAVGEAVLQPGDLLCLYSDGITENPTPEDCELGSDGLVELLQRHREEPLPELVELIDQGCRRLLRGQPQVDDQTLVLVRRV